MLQSTWYYDYCSFCEKFVFVHALFDIVIKAGDKLKLWKVKPMK